MDRVIGILGTPDWYGAAFQWLLRTFAILVLLVAVLAALFLAVRVVRGAKALALADLPAFNKISVVSQLLGITLEQDAKRDEQVSALETRLREVEDKFQLLDSKVTSIKGE